MERHDGNKDQNRWDRKRKVKGRQWTTEQQGNKIHVEKWKQTTTTSREDVMVNIMLGYQNQKETDKK